MTFYPTTAALKTNPACASIPAPFPCPPPPAPAHAFPPEYRGDGFAAEHGSWNRAQRTGYEVIRLPMHNGHSNGEYEDFLTGFTVGSTATAMSGAVPSVSPSLQMAPSSSPTMARGRSGT